MARILAISSYVASGHVGLGAINPALQALGDQVIAIPTVVLSNHPGHPHVSGTRLAASDITAMISALDTNGWLSDVDRVLTGYLPSADHVLAAVQALKSVKDARDVAGRPAPIYVCDPVLGDAPKGLYIETAAANAIRETLVGEADLITPNAFELGWLSGVEVHETDAAVEQAHALPASACLITSLESSDDHEISNVLVSTAADEIHKAPSPRQNAVPNGTGDLLAALAAGALFNTDNPVPVGSKLAAIVSALDDIISESVGQPELVLIPNLGRIRELRRGLEG